MSGTAPATEPAAVADPPRRLEIGPRDLPLEGYDHLDIHPGPHIEHVADATELPFDDESLTEIFACHIIEHIPWYRTEATLREWFRVLRPGGFVEIWTNDFEQLCRRYLRKRPFPRAANEFRDLNPDGNVTRWANIKIFWRDHLGRQEEWHRALFDYDYFAHLLASVGFNVVFRLERHENKGPDHGILEFGVRAFKQGDRERLLAARRTDLRAFKRQQLRQRCRSIWRAGTRFAARATRALQRRAWPPYAWQSKGRVADEAAGPS